jgi:hypothetical protein
LFAVGWLRRLGRGYDELMASAFRDPRLSGEPYIPAGEL